MQSSPRSNNKRKAMKRRNRPRRSQLSLQIPRPLITKVGDLLAPTTITDLKFTDVITLTSGAFNYYAYPLYTNAPYDVDPALGSTATVGLTEYAAFYHKMRVLGYKSTVRVHNTQGEPTQFFVLHQNTNTVTAGGGAVDLQSSCMNPLAVHRLLGHAYSSTAHATIIQKVKISEVIGSREAELDDTYASATNAIPTNLTFLVVGAKSTVGAFTANGVKVVVDLSMRVQFFERKILTA